MGLLAAIDVGSNAIRMVLGSADSKGALSSCEDMREPVRLGADVFNNGLISEVTMRKAEAAFVRFRAALDQHPIQRVRAVGTSALREARNRDEFIRRMEAASGIRVQLISGEEEARLVHKAVASKIELKRKLALLVDVGGGSIEVTLVRDNDIIVSDSVKMGTVRLLHLLDERKRGHKIFYRLLRAYADKLRRQLRKELRNRRIDIVVGTGGNLEAFGDLRQQLLKKAEGDKITAKELGQIVAKLRSLSYAERINKLHLKPDRADVIVPAAILMEELLAQTEANELLIPRVGLKDGVLLDMIAEGKKLAPEAHKRQVLAFARELGRKFNFDEQHGIQVSQFAVQLFEELASVHKLDKRYSLVLEVAALLHDIGQCININGHHKHSYYILRATPFVGLTLEEKMLVAVTARYHRKAHPKLEHQEFAMLPASDRIVVSKLAALLRIADALDCEHLSRVSALRITRRKSAVTLSTRGKGDLLLERWAVEQKAGLFQEIFGLTVSVAE